MPLYEYKCYGCGKTFEVIQKFSDAPLETHPECGGNLERLLSPPALQFKGSGWYVTDYPKKASSDTSSSSNGESSAKKEEKKETKTESSGKKAEKKS